MSNEEIVKRLDTLWYPQFQRLREGAASRAAEIQHEYQGQGTLVLELKRHYKTSIDVAAKAALEIVEVTINAIDPELDSALRQELSLWIRNRVPELGCLYVQYCNENIQFFKNNMAMQYFPQESNIKPYLDTVVKESGAHLENLLDGFMKKPRAQQGGISISNNSGPIAIGTGATAIINQNGVSPEHLVKVLEALTEQLRNAPEASLKNKQEMLEIAEEVKAEIDKPQRNETLLMTLYNLIATTVQTLPSASQAYPAIKAMAATIGILLP